MHLRLILPVCLSLLVLLGAPPIRSSQADVDKWRDRFDIPDQDELFKQVTESTRGGDPSVGLALLETALATEFPHMAVACGDAMRGLDAETVLKDRDFTKALKKARKARTTTEQKNYARFLGAWGHPLLDEEIGYMTSGRRDTEVQAEALFMAGSVQMDAEKKEFPDLRKSIIKALDKGRTESVTAAACSAAGRLGLDDEETTDELIGVVRNSREENEGLYAVWALKLMGFRGGLRTFLHVLANNPKRTTEAACLKGITELCSLEDVPELLSLSKHGDKGLSRCGDARPRSPRLARPARSQAGGAAGRARCDGRHRARRSRRLRLRPGRPRRDGDGSARSPSSRGSPRPSAMRTPGRCGMPHARACSASALRRPRRSANAFRSSSTSPTRTPPSRRWSSAVSSASRTPARNSSSRRSTARTRSSACSPCAPSKARAPRKRSRPWANSSAAASAACSPCAPSATSATCRATSGSSRPSTRTTTKRRSAKSSSRSSA